ncbi:hypothetical protein FRACYDRAFT_241482 [Fragilariopsis cylindrus CCMP1102]|uniref:Uncharacterized protein n=1 Tax=Fragilariopsis cylindrus CCMP1102 TaxID=635003 RepID=A0A1E7F9W2_9STRA|nr:hypothetical protein FRACYDRAFT_241482 [Fragilariopsis cylindrus CCMP1102]|eukprot:OEU14924.1 hypothetical protein FRACYDRAFT_241482 [Fragilariopsis cylindrus CCMP1102]
MTTILRNRSNNSTKDEEKDNEENKMRINTAKAVSKAVAGASVAASVPVVVTIPPTSTSTNNKIQSGIPPWHTIILLLIILILLIGNLPTTQSLDDYATLQIITKTKFPLYLSMKGLGYLRLLIGGIALSLTLHLCLLKDGWELMPNYLPKYTKLQHVKLRLQGFGTLCPFTSISWFILGIGFVLRGLLCLIYVNYHVSEDNGLILNYILQENNSWLLRITFILWELTGPYAVLTSSVVKYVIWPAALRSQQIQSNSNSNSPNNSRKHNLAGYRNQLQHNWNSIFSLLEVTVFGGIPVCLYHITIPILVGCLYMILTWLLGIYYHFGYNNKTNSKDTKKTSVGPQYIYFFMDTSMGILTTYCMVGLLFAMMTIYLFFSVIIQILDTGGGSGGGSGSGSGSGSGDNDTEDSLIVNIIFLIIGILVVCRFRD